MPLGFKVPQIPRILIRVARQDRLSQRPQLRNHIQQQRHRRQRRHLRQQHPQQRRHSIPNQKHQQTIAATNQACSQNRITHSPHNRAQPGTRHNKPNRQIMHRALQLQNHPQFRQSQSQRIIPFQTRHPTLQQPINRSSPQGKRSLRR